MKKSLQNYIHNAGGFIDRDSPILLDSAPLEITQVVTESERPALTVVTSDRIAEEETIAEEPLVEQVIEPLVESNTVSNLPVITESVSNEFLESLRESIDDLRATLLEQQGTQIQLVHLIGELFESVKTHNNNVDHRFESVDFMLRETTATLLETTQKLSQISTREITVPAPVVNVSLTEQKKIIKTVDRDSNGLIRQITEETEQSVSK